MTLTLIIGGFTCALIGYPLLGTAASESSNHWRRLYLQIASQALLIAGLVTFIIGLSKLVP